MPKKKTSTSTATSTTTNSTTSATRPSRFVFRSNETPINFGEFYRNTKGEMFKLVSRTVMYDNPEEFYLLLQSIDERKVTPILVLEDDFKSGIMFEICNRFI